MSTSEDILAALITKGSGGKHVYQDAHDAFNQYWWSQEDSTLVEGVGTVTVVEKFADVSYDSYGSYSGGDKAYIVFQVQSACDCGAPVYYKVSGESTSYGAEFYYPSISQVQQKAVKQFYYE